MFSSSYYFVPQIRLAERRAGAYSIQQATESGPGYGENGQPTRPSSLGQSGDVSRLRHLTQAGVLM